MNHFIIHSHPRFYTLPAMPALLAQTLKFLFTFSSLHEIISLPGTSVIAEIFLSIFPIYPKQKNGTQSAKQIKYRSPSIAGQ